MEKERLYQMNLVYHMHNALFYMEEIPTHTLASCVQVKRDGVVGD